MSTTKIPTRSSTSQAARSLAIRTVGSAGYTCGLARREPTTWNDDRIVLSVEDI